MRFFTNWTIFFHSKQEQNSLVFCFKSCFKFQAFDWQVQRKLLLHLYIMYMCRSVSFVYIFLHFLIYHSRVFVILHLSVFSVRYIMFLLVFHSFYFTCLFVSLLSFFRVPPCNHVPSISRDLTERTGTYTSLTVLFVQVSPRTFSFVW